jgi:uncharacterized protein
LTYISLKCSDYPNQIAASVIFAIPGYSPMSFASKITCPFVLISPKEDNLCLLNAAEEVINAAGDKGELVELPGSEYRRSQYACE